MGLLDLHTHQLQSFLTVAESKSFTAAAEKLYISHTALIQQMNALEKTLGFSLFTRSPRGVVLTESGRTFYEEFQKLIGQADAIITKCRDLEERGAHVRVANMNDLHTFYFYADFYRRFQKENPQIVLDFVPTAAENVLDMCRSGEIDVGFYFGLEKQAENPSLFFRAATISNMCIVVSRSNPLVAHGRITAQDLEGKTVYAFNVSDPNLIYDQVSPIPAGKLQLFDATMQSIFEKCEAGEPMILQAFLLAPTVPSEPRPQNLQEMIDLPEVTMFSPTGREVKVTSSRMPMVKWFFCSPAILSNTALIWAGVVSLEERP